MNWVLGFIATLLYAVRLTHWAEKVDPVFKKVRQQTQSQKLGQK